MEVLLVIDTCPIHSGPALSTVTCTSSPASLQLSSSWGATGAGRGAAAVQEDEPRRSRRESSEWMAGRSGARPIPPATMTTSTPCSCSVGQGRPKGPRTDSRWPTDASQIACVAIPTARTVWTSGPNAYCHDSQLTWMDWTLAGKNAELLRFFSKCIAFRKKLPS